MVHLPNIYSAAVRKYYAIGLNDWTVTYESGDKTVATVWASARLVLPDGGDRSSTLRILFEINSSEHI